MSGPRLTCLLPVRNGSADLPGWFRSVANFADAVVALDDGSTDDTADILSRHPAVTRVIRRDLRPGYAGWNDSANRNRLLEAVADLDPQWIFFLDVDERLDAADGRSLRRFVKDEASSEFAYGFEVFRMVEDLEKYDAADTLWVYRLFLFSPGLSLPEKRLHFVPVPTAIPRRRWLRTRLRIQHVGAIDPDHRQARYEKYRQADPRNEYQADYTQLLADPTRVAAWVARPETDPVVLPVHRATSLETKPAFSVVIISQNDEHRIEEVVGAAVGQVCSRSFEVIVVASGTDRTAGLVRRQFPEVRLVELTHPALPGEARNAGWRIARGDFVAFPGSHVALARGSLQARLGAHEAGYAMVSGPLGNGTDTTAGWASYFLDHSGSLPVRPSSELRHAPARCSYVRFLLREVGGFPEDMRAGEDTVVNLELFRRGYSAYHAAGALEVHTSPCRDLRTLLRHHHQRGRAWGAILLARYGSRRRLVAQRTAHLLGYVPRRLLRIRRNIGRTDREHVQRLRRAFPFVVLGAVAAWAGMLRQIVAPQIPRAD